MPKIVDYAQRRRDLVEATTRIIVRQGLSGTTMRDIAAEAGFANGVVKSYFARRPTSSPRPTSTSTRRRAPGWCWRPRGCGV